ncbi:MAG TPA: hypothetical protein VFV27_05995 [Nevskiaceae bacterium]|nr:hypothetical protein [Nevskiaceae bacterium]
MPSLVPAQRPQLPRSAFEALLRGLSVDLERYPLIVGGLRGYFGAQMHPGEHNRRAVYDDALFVYAPALNLYRGFNGNTDPSSVREGYGQAEATRGMACLLPGFWPAYRFDVHGGSQPHEAICQRAADVEVLRDGRPPYRHRGRFGINIHRGGYRGTSSLGCQTVPPSQWPEFLDTAQQAARQLFGTGWKQRVVGYALFDQASYTGSENRPVAAAGSPRERALAFLEGTLRPVLQAMGARFASRHAEQLLLGTALVESDLTHRRQLGNGPARGLFQMEMATHDDIWRHYLAYQPALAALARGFKRSAEADAETELVENDRYACAMARLHYFRVRSALPASGAIRDLGQYWKDHYNTPLGRGTVEKFVQKWQAAMGTA